MQVHEALTKRRTIRKFTQRKIDRSDLLQLIDYARVCAYPANIQPLKFAVIDTAEKCEKIFPLTKWAGYLADGAPKKGEEPVAYIAVLGDKGIKKSFETEAGTAITAMMTGAYSMGIATCWLGSVKRTEVLETLNINKEQFELVYLLALGYPAQESRTVKMVNNDAKYFYDDKGVLNVPKKSLEEIVLF